jgi:bidirectional [NiFe] hydrogenase diaphorase subunit
VRAQAVGCLGLCGSGPLVALDLETGAPASTAPRGLEPRRHQRLYGGLAAEQASDLIAIARWLVAQPPGPLNNDAISRLHPHQLDPDLPFFRSQRPLVLQHCGWVEPDSIASALAMGTYGQLLRCLAECSPAEVRALIDRSGLRGRGGAGFPTGVKWERVAGETGTPKLVVANGDEGDPGAFMDRTVMESDPHRLLEGLAIAAYAVGADRGVLFVRAEYPQAVAQLRRAIRQAESHGLLGASIGGSGVGVTVKLRVGAGAYVCGEETALMAAVEGRRGTPRTRPPYPARSGLWGKPTLINNVETLAAVPAILAMGAEAYRALGSGRSRGTKVFSLSGAVRHTGLVEVPMGTSLRTVVEELGGGSLPGRRIKAVQTGGPGGGFVPEHLLDTPIDYEALVDLGTAMGSGGLVVIGDDVAIPELVAHGLRFCAEESCGKCVPCRAGTVQLLTLLERLQAGGGDRGREHTLFRLEELAAMVQACSLCGLGQGAPRPLLNSLRFFRSEYTAPPLPGAAR